MQGVQERKKLLTLGFSRHFIVRHKTVKKDTKK